MKKLSEEEKRQKADEGFLKACEILKISTDLPDVSMLDPIFRAHMISHYKLMVIIRSRNIGFKHDYNDYSQWKHFPYWDMETYDDAPVGSGFSLNAVFSECTLTCVGAPFVSENEATAKAIATDFECLYKDIMKPLD